MDFTNIKINESVYNVKDSTARDTASKAASAAQTTAEGGEGNSYSGPHYC